MSLPQAKSRLGETAPNKACTRLGVRAAFFSIFLAYADFRFEGESTLPPQAGNASRWAPLLDAMEMNDMTIYFTNPAINYYVENVEVAAQFYIEHFGFVETFRTPQQGVPVHVEVTLGSFVLGIESQEASQMMHGLPLVEPRGFPHAELALRTENVDEAYARLMEKGVVSMSAPRNLLPSLRVAWIKDPDGNPVRIVTRK